LRTILLSLRFRENEVEFNVEETENTINLIFDEKYTGKTVYIYVDDELLLPATVGKKAQVKISKKSNTGKRLVKALNQGRIIRVTI